MNPYRTDGRNSDTSDDYSTRADPIDRDRADAIMAVRRLNPRPHGELHPILMEYARLRRTNRHQTAAKILWNNAKSAVADAEILPAPSDFDFNRRGDAQESRYELIGDDGRTYPILIRIESDEDANLFEDSDGTAKFSDRRSAHDSIDQHEGEDRGRSRHETSADHRYFNMPTDAVKDSARYWNAGGTAKHESYLRADAMRFNELQTARDWCANRTHYYGIIVEVYEPGAIIDPDHEDYDGAPDPIAEESCWGYGQVESPERSRYVRESMADHVRSALAKAEESCASALYASVPVCGAD